ncbi:hypothetical protein Bca4012_044191 [Brassica carinata]
MLFCAPMLYEGNKKRSYKEKRSAYAPEAGMRYDGVYRIEKCWLKVGVQGSFKSNAAGYAAVTNMEIVQDLCLSLRAIDMFERNETSSLDQRF